MSKKIEKAIDPKVALAMRDDQIKALQKQLAEARSEMKEYQEMNKRSREEAEGFKKERDWWHEVANQARMFLLGLSNTVALAGRGWKETQDRLDQARPVVREGAYTMTAQWKPAGENGGEWSLAK